MYSSRSNIGSALLSIPSTAAAAAGTLIKGALSFTTSSPSGCADVHSTPIASPSARDTLLKGISPRLHHSVLFHARDILYALRSAEPSAWELCLAQHHLSCSLRSAGLKENEALERIGAWLKAHTEQKDPMQNYRKCSRLLQDTRDEQFWIQQNVGGRSRGGEHYRLRVLHLLHTHWDEINAKYPDIDGRHQMWRSFRGMTVNKAAQHLSEMVPSIPAPSGKAEDDEDEDSTSEANETEQDDDVTAVSAGDGTQTAAGCELSSHASSDEGTRSLRSEHSMRSKSTDSANNKRKMSPAPPIGQRTRSQRSMGPRSVVCNA
jgi:hypothetical protein